MCYHTVLAGIGIGLHDTLHRLFSAKLAALTPSNSLGNNSARYV